MSVSLVVRVIISGKGWYDGAGDDEDAGVADGRAVLDGVVGVVPAQVPPALREGRERMKCLPVVALVCSIFVTFPSKVSFWMYSDISFSDLPTAPWPEEALRAPWRRGTDTRRDNSRGNIMSVDKSVNVC